MCTKGVTGGAGWVQLKEQHGHVCMHGLGCRNALALSRKFAQMGLEKSPPVL